MTCGRRSTSSSPSSFRSVRILVLNGVNLERARAARPQAVRRLVDRRARVADLPVGARRQLERAVQADEQRRRLRQLDPRGARLGRRRHRESGRVDALQLRNPRRARAVRGPDRRSASVERRRARRVATQIGDLGPRRAPYRRQRAHGIQGGDRMAVADPERTHRPASFVPRRAAARHDRRERALPHRLPELERGAAGRRGSRPALHRLPLRGGSAFGSRARSSCRRSAPSSRRSRRSSTAASASRRPRSPSTTGRRCRTPASISSRAGASSSGCVRSRTRTSSQTIREAARITDHVYAALAEERFVGRTERDVAWRMEQIFHELGADATAFEIIVGSGPTGAMPHGRPTDRVIEPNTTVVVDAGAVLDSYNSDCTRTFATGELPDDLAEAYDVCLRGQLAGLEAMRAGASGADADAAARSVIDDAGLGEKFGHGLGHGVGLLVHEAPTARPESEDVLEAGNVITCEPGIYLEGRGGVRIEDLVLITEGDPDVLSSYTKDLVTVS